VIARLLKTKQAQFISRLESPSSPQPSPPLFVEAREPLRARRTRTCHPGTVLRVLVPSPREERAGRVREKGGSVEKKADAVYQPLYVTEEIGLTRATEFSPLFYISAERDNGY
jgi:hypothetical protein